MHLIFQTQRKVRIYFLCTRSYNRVAINVFLFLWDIVIGWMCTSVCVFHKRYHHHRTFKIMSQCTVTQFYCNRGVSRKFGVVTSFHRHLTTQGQNRRHVGRALAIDESDSDFLIEKFVDVSQGVIMSRFDIFWVSYFRNFTEYNTRG